MSISKEDVKDIFEGIRVAGELIGLIQIMVTGDTKLLPCTKYIPKQEYTCSKEAEERKERIKYLWRDFMA